MPYTPYPAYKPSGVEWLGEIPVGWEIRRLKFAASLRNERSSVQSEQLAYLGLEHIESGTGVVHLVSNTSEVESITNLFKKNDILFSKLRPYLAKVVHAQFDGVCTSELLVLQPSQGVEPKFLFYYLLSDLIIRRTDSLTYGVKMPRVSWNQIADFPVPISELSEQRAITTFLDHKLAKIDTLVAKKRRLIELLHERRAALINYAVTRGMNADVPLQESGSEWLGKIPAGWTMQRLKSLCDLNVETLSESTDPDYLIQYVDIGSVTPYGMLEEPLELRFEDAPSRARRIVRAGDTIMATVRTYLQAIAFFDNVSPNLVVSTGFAVLRPKNHVEPRYLYYLVRSPQFIDVIVAHSTGVSYPAITSSVLAALPTCLPPLDEQRVIASFLDHELAKLDVLVSKIDAGIRSLQEYRMALIGSAVTGKIDVRSQVAESVK